MALFAFFVVANLRGAVRLLAVAFFVVVLVRIVCMSVSVTADALFVRNPLRSYRISRARIARVEMDPTPRLIGVLPMPGARCVLVRSDGAKLHLDATARLRFQHAWSYPIAAQLAGALGVPVGELRPRRWWPDPPSED